MQLQKVMTGIGSAGHWLRKRDFFKHVAMIALLVLVFYPFIALINLSFKDYFQFTHHPWGVTVPFRWQNYQAAFKAIMGFIKNSLLVSTVSVIGVLALASTSAYQFSRFNFPGREFLYYLLIALLMIPGILNLVPQFILVKNLGLLNTYWALILPYWSGGQVFAIFILRAFFQALPSELFDSARIDGASELQVLWSIVMPMSKSILGTVAIMNILGTWNDLVWPWVTISDPKKMTITIGLNYFRGSYYTNWGPLFAGYVIAALPLIILFMFTSRYFVRGLTSGAFKM